MKKADKIKAIVIDKTSMSRELTVAALQAQNNIDVLGAANDAETIKRHVISADVALLQAELPTNEALLNVETLINYNPDLKILVIGLKKSETAALAFIEAGAKGYVFEGDSFTGLIKNIVAAYNDRARVSARMATFLMERLQELRALTAKLDHVYQYRQNFEQLTPREQEILHLIGEGKSNRKIARELFVEIGTVKNHVHNILKKLQVRSRHDAAAFLALESQAAPAFGN